MNLFYDSIAMMGICFILKYGAILNFIRKPLQRFSFFKELFSCSLCMGFWIGFIYAAIHSDYNFTLAFYASAVCWISDYVIQTFQKHLYT